MFGNKKESQYVHGRNLRVTVDRYEVVLDSDDISLLNNQGRTYVTVGRTDDGTPVDIRLKIPKNAEQNLVIASATAYMQPQIDHLTKLKEENAALRKVCDMCITVLKDVDMKNLAELLQQDINRVFGEDK